MTTGAALKLILGLTLFGAAAWLWLRPHTIETAQADAIAKAMAVRFAAGTGEPVVHFGTARRFSWPDGWEFVWTYRPCPHTAALRVFVPLDGRHARFTETPDCDAKTGFRGALTTT